MNESSFIFRAYFLLYTLCVYILNFIQDVPCKWILICVNLSNCAWANFNCFFVILLCRCWCWRSLWLFLLFWYISLCITSAVDILFVLSSSVIFVCSYFLMLANCMPTILGGWFWRGYGIKNSILEFDILSTCLDWLVFGMTFDEFGFDWEMLLTIPGRFISNKKKNKKIIINKLTGKW